MTGEPWVGLALIARDEQDTLPTLLASIDGAFDAVVLIDTGSRDRTIEVFNGWCREQRRRHEHFACAWKPHPWIDDFSDARQAADELLLGEAPTEAEGRPVWMCWADCDDEIRGAGNLRQLAATATPSVAGFVFDYAYAHDQHGNVVCSLKRERLVRAGHGTWQGRVHEAQEITGHAEFAGPAVAEWVHHPDPERGNSDRNVRILTSWLTDEPRNPRVLAYLGTEALARGDHEDAAEFFGRYLAEPTGWDEERCQVLRKQAISLMALGRGDEARQAAFQAMAILPRWPDNALTLAEAAYQARDWPRAVEWAGRALELGAPETLLIINPLEYAFQPRLILAGALGAMGRPDEAMAAARDGLALVPGHQELAHGLRVWEAQARRERSAAQAVEMAQVLVGHDEQAKALKLLEECVPYFAVDHPSVVGARSQLRERLAFVRDQGAYGDHYAAGGTKPEDFAVTEQDEDALRVAGQLPRMAFLVDGLRELQAEAA